MSVISDSSVFGGGAIALQDVDQLDGGLSSRDDGETHRVEGRIGGKMLANTARIAEVAEMKIIRNRVGLRRGVAFAIVKQP